MRRLKIHKREPSLRAPELRRPEGTDIDMKNILIFERTVYLRPLDRLLFIFCLLRQPDLLRFVFVRFWASFLRFFGACGNGDYRRLRWGFLDYVGDADKKLEAFWKRESGRAYRLFPEDGNIWLTLYPEKAAAPLARMAGAELLAGSGYQELYEKAAAAGKPSLVADAYPPKVKTEAELLLIRKGMVMSSAAECRLRGLADALYTFFALLCSGVGLGLLSLYFGAGPYRLEMFKTYFSNPWTPALNIIPVALLVFFTYFLFNRVWLAFFASAAFTLLLSLINYFKLSLRNDPLLFTDVNYAFEGGTMALERYSLDVNYKVVLAVAICLICTVAAFFLVRGRIRSARLRVLGLLCAAGLFVFLYGRLYTSAELYDKTENLALVSRWSATGQYVSRGFVYPFLYSAKDASETPPDGYDKKEAAAILAGYGYDDIPEGEKVNVVAVMLEAFNDFTKFGVLDFAEDVYGPFHELQKKSLSGNLITNIFAGNTVDTEWCFLTGYSDVEGYRKNTNSHVWYFREQGYYAEGCHPCYEWFYNRLNVNRYLGFENYYFYENKYDTGGNGIAGDDALFPSIVQLLEEHLKSSEAPYFSFSVTYQNHGPYDGAKAWYDREYVRNRGYTDEEYNILNNYFCGIANTVKNVAETADKLSSLDEPTVFIVFGDHNPWMGNNASVYKTLGVNFDFGTDEGFCNYYETPYIIYANDAAKRALGNNFVGKGLDLSPCFLMNYFFDIAGWGGNEYMKLSADMLKVSPLVHMYGLFIQDGRLTYDLSGEGKAVYDRYMRGQYYWENTFDQGK